mmetsp:Transcript_132603/g.383326  ORF Transcript_132603/g.383326 Transcript_132603/m.383326 type:complete len:745 (+) Transcript_132603:16-2250(+)
MAYRGSPCAPLPAPAAEGMRAEPRAMGSRTLRCGRPRRMASGAAAAALVALSSLCGAVGAPVSVSIVLAADVTKCLGVLGRQVTLRHCMNGQGLAWLGDTASLSKVGKLGMLAVELPGGEVKQARRLGNEQPASPAECLRLSDTQFMLWPCDMTDTTFQWDAETLQLKTGGKCLGSVSGALALVDCHTLAGFGTDNGGDAARDTDQNGHGAPATQTWVLLPTDRPQVNMLDVVELPLRASGRYVVDSNGARVKLVGVNWLSVLTKHAAVPGTATPEQIAQTIKYLGFNAVRIAFSDDCELSELDAVVKAATNEKLLVVLARRMDDLPLANETDKQTWLKSLTFVTGRYKDNLRVVGVDLHSGPALQEDSEFTSLPTWGLSDMFKQPAEALGVRLVDWRRGAAEGAVAVWSGNPNALAVVQGAWYGTDLKYVSELPMGFAQECLFSRVVYGTQEHHWSASLFDFISSVGDMWNPKDGIQQAKSAIAKAKAAKAAAVVGSGATSSLEQPPSYEEYLSSRNKAAYYLDADGKAPVWVSELSTSTKKGNDWWAYTLRSLRESDASWFYFPLGARGQDDVQSLFEPSIEGGASVIGWKLQDLLSIQRPSTAHPPKLARPGACAFDAAKNAEAVLEDVPLQKFLTTMSQTQLAFLIIALVLLLIVLLCICRCCCKCCCGRRRGDKVQRDIETLNPVPEKEPKNLWCCSCQRRLPVTVPDKIASMLPDGATVPAQSGYSQLDSRGSHSSWW